MEGYFCAIQRGRDMTRVILRALFPGGIFVVLSVAPLYAQTAAVDDLKGKIFDAKMAQQTFAGGLRHCSELDGTNFYFQARDRVLNLDEYHRALDSLAQQGVFNPETKRPWSQQDAEARWTQVQKQAGLDKANCALVASLPELQKKLDDLQREAATAPGHAPQGGK
jgi:hypothetical protein